MQRRLTTLAAAALVVAAMACGSGSVRPSFKPFPQSPVDTVKGSPSAVIQEIAARLTAENLFIQWSSPAEGYIETQQYNVVTRQSGNSQNADRENSVTIRFWADSIGAGTSRVTGEATYIRSSDPSVFGRDRDAPVQPGHPGIVLVKRILDGLHERFGH